jgi:hypothetical protein
MSACLPPPPACLAAPAPIAAAVSIAHDSARGGAPRARRRSTLAATPRPRAHVQRFGVCKRGDVAVDGVVRRGAVADEFISSSGRRHRLGAAAAAAAALVSPAATTASRRGASLRARAGFSAPLIAPTDTWGMWAAILCASSFGLWGDQQSWGAWLGGRAWHWQLLSATLSTSIIIPRFLS